MVYERWYFCYQAKVSAAETTRYLEILSVLEENRYSGKEKLRALADLEKLEMLMQGFAVPVLVQSLFLLRSGYGMEIQWDYQEEERFCNKVIEMLKRAAGLSQPLVNLTDKLGTEEYSRMVEALRAILEKYDQNGRPVEKMDYLETDLYRKEILILSMLKSVALLSPEYVSELVKGETRHPFIKNALNGLYGQLPWNLTVEILNLCQESVFGLMTMFPSDWFTRPDMMELAAEIRFKGDAEQMIKESCRYTFLREHFQTGAEYYRGFWALPYVGNDEYIRICAVMWQNILWLAALKSDPDYSIREINKIWKVSQRAEGIEGGINSLNYVQKKFIPYQSARYTWEEILRRTACPWIAMAGNKGKKNWGKYENFSNNSTALKVFAAIPIMQNILTRADKEEENFNFVFLILQWSAAFSCKLPRHFVKEQDKAYSSGTYRPWSHAISLLGYYANRVLHGIGRGKVNALLPGWIVNQIDIVRSGEGESDEDIYKLCSTDALDSAAHWACSSLAECGKEGSREENPWFADGRSSCAAAVCSMIFEDGIENISSRYALLLAYQAYPEYMERMPNSWVRTLEGNPQYLVNVQNLIKEELPGNEEWRKIVPFEKANFNDEGKKMALTMRLSSLLETEEVSWEEPWIQEWVDNMASLNAQTQLSSLVRYEIVKLLQLRPAFQGSRDSLFSILKILIQVIDEFTTFTSFYYQKLLIQQLEKEEVFLGEQSWEQLRMELIMDLYGHSYGETGAGWNDTTEKKYLLLLSFMMQMEKCIRKRNHVNELCEFWKRERVQSSQLRFERKKQLEVSQTLAYHMWAKDGNEIVAVGRKENFQKVKHDRRTPVISLFESEGEINETCQYVGIVMGKKEGRKENRGKPELYINYGKNEPVVYQTKDREDKMYNIGDVVFLKFSNGKVDSIKQEALLPQEGDRINGEVQFYPSRIVMKAWGEQWEIDGPAESLNMWYPDISQVLQEKPMIKKCRMEWRNGQWMPVTKDFAQLIAEQFVGKMDRTISLTFIRQERCGEKVQWIFSYQPGENYGIFNEFLDKNCFTELYHRQKSEIDGGAGLIMHLQLKAGEDGRPVLAFSRENPIDDRNIRWKNQFAEEDTFVAKKNENGKWMVDSKAAEIEKEISVNILGKRRPSRNASRLNVQLEGDWDFRGQRNASVDVKLVSSRRLASSMEYGQLYDILNMKAGDFFELNYVECKRTVKGYYFAILTSGIVVNCAAESFSAADADDIDSRALYEKRKCVIEYIDSRKSREENANFQPYVSEELGRYDGPFQGIVAEIPENIQENQEQTLEITVNLLIGGEIYYMKAPASAFSPLPVYTGEPVTAEWMGRGWKFKVQPRKIYVRALWKLKNHKAEQSPALEGKAIGTAWISGMGTGLLVQGNNAVLHFYGPNTEWEESGRTMQTDRHFNKLQEPAFRRCSTRIFRETYETLIVKACDEEGALIGETRNEDFADAAEWKAEIKVRYFSDAGGEALYDFRRVFVSLSTNSQKEQEKIQRQNEEYLQDYKEWLEAGDFHAAGSMKRSGEGFAVRLYDLSLPADLSVSEEEFAWTQTVQLKEDECPWVQGRKYKNDDVRVKLQVENNRWTASWQEAEPMRLDIEFANIFGGECGDNEVEQVLYFAGIDEEERMRFEWGFGYKLLASQEDVTDMDGNLVSEELFFGDKITRFRLVEGEGEFGWKMKVAISGIVHELEYKIMEDSLHDVIQLLEVRRDVEKGQVKIQQVSVIAREVGASGWALESMPNAVLDEESVKELLKLETEEDVFVILGKQQMNGDRKKMTSLKFSYIPLDGDASQTQILEGKVLCLVAGEIRDNYVQQSSRIVNDCSIDFYLQKELPERNRQEEKSRRHMEFRKSSRKKPHIWVNVARRHFSLDESRLRVLQDENPFAYYGSNMLVRLYSRRERRKTDWNGSVIAVPLRSEKSLKEWVKSKEPRLVLMGSEVNKSHVKVEIAPGILSRVKKSNIQGKAMPGALAALTMEGEELKAEQLLPGDASYISQDGRAVELLVMDGALNGYSLLEDKGNTKEERSGQKYDFTVAGFPQLRLKDEEALKQVITEEPPRLAYLSANRKGELAIRLQAHATAVFLTIDETSGNPVLEKRIGKVQKRKTKWNYISFKDGTIGEIRRHVERGRWHYHDKRTGIWQADERKMVQVNWPESDEQHGITYDNIPLFPAKGNRLRYAEQELMKFSYPARELCENGLPEKDGWYPVAAADGTRVWIELLPGRILDIPKKYLFIGRKGRSLANMATLVLGAGDEIKLGETKRTADELPKILVENIRFGMRSSFSYGTVYLPVEDVRQDGIVLGSGRFHLTLPEAHTEGWTKESVGRLEADNTLYCCDQTPALKPGDTVMLIYDKKLGFKISGMPEITVRLSYKSWWRDLKWLYNYLWSRRNAADNLFQDGIPVKVTHVTEEEGQTVCRVLYEQPVQEAFEVGTEMCCNVIGEISDKNGMHEIVLRSGGYLFQMDGKEFISGLPEADCRYVCRKLSDDKICFWVHKEEDGWKPGLKEEGANDSVQMELLDCIPQAGGIVCRDNVRYRLWWLPARQAARVKNVLVENIFQALQKKKEKLFQALVMEDGTVSLTHASGSYTRFVTMGEGNQQIARAVPLIQLEEQSEETCHYLAELHPNGDIVSLFAEKGLLNSKTPEPLPVNVIRKEEQEIIVVSVTMKRERLNLSPWVIAAYRESCQNGRFSSERFAERQPERYGDYHKAIRQSIEDAEMGRYQLPDADIDCKLVYLYSLWTNPAMPTEKKKQMIAVITTVLLQWVRKSGLAMATGFDEKYSMVKSPKMDLFPTLAAILLLDRSVLDKAECKKLAVHLTRVLGMLCNNSLYQEYILNQWLLHPERRGLWERLSGLSLGGETIKGEASPSFDGMLTVTQKKNMIYGCRNIKNNRNYPEELRTTAECLLFAAGAEEDYSSLYQKLTRDKSLACSRLAYLYRALLPGAGLMTAVEKLDGYIRSIMESRFQSMAREDSLPVTLITDNVFPLKEEEKKWAAKLCRTILVWR